MGVVNSLVSRALRKAARVIDPPPTIHRDDDEYITWLCYADPGMLEKGNLYSIDYAISHLPCAAPILSTNVIAHFKRKRGVRNPLITCDKWDFENVNRRSTIADSPVLFSEYRAFSKESYVRNIKMFSRDDLPFTFEKTANEFFDAWKGRQDCADVLGRSFRLGGALSFCYIDGNHTYDYARQDFLHCDSYLDVGGFILFDDSTLPEFSLYKLMPEVMALERYRLVAANPYHLFQKIQPAPQKT